MLRLKVSSRDRFVMSGAGFFVAPDVVEDSAKCQGKFIQAKSLFDVQRASSGKLLNCKKVKLTESSRTNVPVVDAENCGWRFM